MRYLPSLPRKYKAVLIAGGVAFCLCAFSAIFGSRGVIDLRRMQRQQVEAEAMAFALADENRRMRDHLDRVTNDDLYLEKLARERIGLIKPGEIVYRVNRRTPHAEP